MKNKRQSFLVSSILLFSTLSSFAQDPHFSQYFSSPLSLNPANTGNFYGSNRLGVHYRNQWMGIGDPYMTGMVSLDGKLLKNKLKEDDKFGIGLMGLYDQSVGGALNSTYAALSVAYHKGLDEDGKQSLGLGFQGVIGNRRLDYNKISFYNQFGSDGFNISMPSGENFTTASLVYFDFNLGGIYSYEGESKSFYLGASYYHIPRPKQSFLGDTSNRLDSRYSIHSGASVDVGDNGRIFLSAVYMQQAKSSELAVGINYGYSVPGSDGETSLILGIWYRNKDALYPYLGIQHHAMLLGFSYDITTSNLSLAETKNKSLELSCVVTFRDKSKLRKLIPWY